MDDFSCCCYPGLWLKKILAKVLLNRSRVFPQGLETPLCGVKGVKGFVVLMR